MRFLFFWVGTHLAFTILFSQNPVNGNCNGPEDDEIKKPEAGEIPPKQEVKETEQEKKQEKQAEKSLEIEKSEVKSDSETEKKVTEPEVNQSEVAPEQAETEETKEEPMEEGVDEDDDEDDDSEEELPRECNSHRIYGKLIVFTEVLCSPLSLSQIIVYFHLPY